MSKRHRRDRKSTPFRTAANQDPERRAELERRVLGDLEDCRLAWEQEHDPLALIVAVGMADGLEIPLPPWLAYAVLGVMAAAFNVAGVGDRLRLPELWTKRSNQAVDAQRAEGVLLARTDPTAPLKTLEDAYQYGATIAAEHAGAPYAASAKESYLHVVAGLANDHRYRQAPPVAFELLKLALTQLPPALRERMTSSA